MVSIRVTHEVDSLTGEVELGTIPVELRMFGPCPWSRQESFEKGAYTALKLGQHVEYARDMEEKHGWTYLHVENGKHHSYVLLDSHGTLYSILSF